MYTYVQINTVHSDGLIGQIGSEVTITFITEQDKGPGKVNSYVTYA